MKAFQATVQDEDGNAIFSPVVTVYREDGVTLANIYTEAGVALPNPLTGTLQGFVQFYFNDPVVKVRGARGGDQTELWTVDGYKYDYVYQTRAEAIAMTRALPALSRIWIAQEGVAAVVVAAAALTRHYTVTATGQGLLLLGGSSLIGAGQSNMASSNVASEGGDLTPDPRIRFWDGTAWVQWDVASAALNWASQPNRNNILFQAAKQALRDGVPAVWCVLDAHPGNQIDQWIANPNTGTNGPNMTSLLLKAGAALGSAEAVLAGVNQAGGFIWGQGENNGGASFDLDDYTVRFNWIKTKLRAQSWFPNATPITCMSMPPQPSSRVMDRFFKGVIPYDGDPFTSFTDNTDQPAPEGNLMHWTGVAMNTIGMRAWRQIQRGGISLQNPAISIFPYVRWHLEPVNGFGMGMNYVAGADASENRFVLGTVSGTSGAGLAQNFIAWWRARSLMQCLQHTWFEGGLTLKSYTLAQLGTASHPANTDPNRSDGTMYSVTNGSLAKWNSFQSRWEIFAPTSNITPT